MRTINKTVDLYSFKELPPEGQQTAIDDYLQSQEWFGGDECTASLKAFCIRVGITLRNWSLGYRSDIRWEFDACDCFRWSENWYRNQDTGNDGSHMKGIRLWKWLQNGNWAFLADDIREASKGSCPLTGTWSDCPLFDAFTRFLDKPNNSTTFDDLLQEAKSDFESACDKDYEYCFSEEAAREMLENSDDEFTADGEQY